MAALDRLVNPQPWPAQRYVDACHEGRGPQALVSEADTGLQGFLVYSRVVDEATLENLVVDPQQRRQGLARRLLEEAISRWQRLACRRCLLEVRADNHAARALYERFAFVEDGRRRNYYLVGDGQRVDAVLMSREL